jgi:hypothetical protein
MILADRASQFARQMGSSRSLRQSAAERNGMRRKASSDRHLRPGKL